MPRNGGSASNISHFITDLGKCSSDAIGRRFRCLSLNENLSWITAKTAGTLDGGVATTPLAGLENFVLTCVVPGLGLPLALAALLGALVSLVRRTRH